MRKQVGILLVSVFIIAICGLLYELLISTLTSYFQGSSILHFSITIGLFLSFMGVGSFLSRFIKGNLIEWFIGFELWLGITGGFSSIILYMAFSMTSYFYLFTFLVIALIGILIGVEIPILTRIVRKYDTLREALANVLSFDYLGALIASLLFPLVLLPTFGTMRTAFLVGMLNVGVAIMNTWQFRENIRKYSLLMSSGVAGLLMLLIGFLFSFQLLGFFEQFLYQDEIVLSRQSSYQRIALTRWNNDTRLFLDGNLQFSSRDEHRYHEPLVHIPMNLALRTEKILVLGGGDGLAVKQILTYPEVQAITVVDLDPVVTELGQKHPLFTQINEGALNHPKVTIINRDAYNFVKEATEFYDVIITDLPDPNNPSLGKLYSQEFYGLIKKCLSTGGSFVTQSTSPYFARRAFWCIHQTLESQFPYTYAYQSYIPSFGIWGFNVSISVPQSDTHVRDIPEADPFVKLIQQKINSKNLKFLHQDMINSMFVFDLETEEIPVKLNQLEDQQLIRYYDSSLSQWR